MAPSQLTEDIRLEAQADEVPTPVASRSDPLYLRSKWWQPTLLQPSVTLDRPLQSTLSQGSLTLDHPLQGAIHCFAIATAIVHHMFVTDLFLQLPPDTCSDGIRRYEVAVSYIYLVMPIFQWSVIAYGIEHLSRWAQHMLQILEGVTLISMAVALTFTTIWRHQASCDQYGLFSCDFFMSISKTCFDTQLAGTVYFTLTFYGSRIYGHVRPEARGTWHLTELRKTPFRIRYPWLFTGHVLQTVLSIVLMGLTGKALSLAVWPKISSGFFLFLTYASIQNLITSIILLVHCCLLPRSPRARRMGEIMETVAMITAFVAAFDADLWQSEYGCEEIGAQTCTTIYNSIRPTFGLQLLSASGHVIMFFVEGYPKEPYPENLETIYNLGTIAFTLGLKYLGILIISPVLGTLWIFERFTKSERESNGDTVRGGEQVMPVPQTKHTMAAVIDEPQMQSELYGQVD